MSPRRNGEIRNLQWRDLDFETGFLIVRDTKNGETRHVPMDSTVVALLRNWPRTAGSDFVFTNAAGGRIGWLQHGFRKALSRAGLSDLHFHDLRHTFASQWMMAGGDLYVLKSILGHKSIAMTQRYAHLSPGYKKAMVERMEQIWAKPVKASLKPVSAPTSKVLAAVRSSCSATNRCQHLAKPAGSNVERSLLRPTQLL